MKRIAQAEKEAPRFVRAALESVSEPRQEGEADNCPTCGLASCIGRFQDANCDHDEYVR